MSTRTTNLNLIKPELDENFKLSDWNSNLDTLDDYAGAVNTALAGKQATLTFDTAPTADSTNPVTSGGVFHEIYICDVELAAGDDLNNLTTPGRYRCRTATIAGSILNTPYTASGFFVLVEKVSDITIQTLYSVTTAGSRYFKRVMGSVNIGAWFSYPNEGRLAEVVYGTGTEIVLDQDTPANNDLDLFRTPGVYYSGIADTSRGLANCPFKDYGFRLEVRACGTARCAQFLYPITRTTTHKGEGEFYYRQYGTDNAWGSWYKFAGTAVTT